MTRVPDLFGLQPVFESADSRRAADPRTLAGPHPAIDEIALAGFLCFSHIPTPRSVFAGVSRVPAPPPWRSDAASAPLDAARLRELLEEAVRKRLPAGPDEPIGVYLSGGLDSSLVAALAVEAGARAVAFTLDFGPPHDEELSLARAVAAHLKIPLRVVPARPADIARALTPTAAALPQPFGDGVTVPLYLLGEAAARETGTVWNGEGGDQLFGGWTNKPLVAAGIYGATDLVAEYLQTYHRFYGLLDSLATPPWRERIAGARPAEWIAPHLDADAHPTLLHRLRAANLALKGAQNIAPRCVALAACHGLKVAAPFFDEPLAEATFSLPPEAFLQGACEKFLLKKAAAPLLPPEIVWREKRGMGAPTAQWCLDDNPVRRTIRSLLAPRRLRREGRLDPDFVQGLLTGHDPTPAAFRRRRVGDKLWCLAHWAAWREAHGLR